MVTIRGNNELGETTTLTTFFHTPESSHPGTPECVLELHAPFNDPARHLIDTRPLTTSRGEGDNLEVIKSWLNSCQLGHALCQQRDNVSANLPSRLVEIVDSRIVRLIETAGEVGRYVALSYCWGSEPTGSAMSKRANLRVRLSQDGLCRADLPATIRDGITVTERLGIKYIWIDSLCIVQDDTEDKHAELGKMSQYYRNSFLTIAASTPSATTGFIGKWGRCEKHPDSPLPRDLVPLDVFAHIHDSKDSGVAGKIYVREENPYQLHEEPINKRGWTLQECILAPRVLLFGSRVIWFCQHMTHSDGGIEDWSFEQNDLEGTRREFQVQLCKLEKGDLDSEMISGSPGPTNGMRDMYSLWHRLVGTYSRRAISYPADKLPAISAVAAEFSKLANDTYLAGLWRLNLPRDLLWTTPEAFTHRSKTWRAPTWSWASVDDAIIYKRQPPDNATLLAEVLEVEAVPLTEVAPFGEVQRGSLVISGPSFPVTIKDDEGRKKISEPWIKDFKFTPGNSEREMFLESLTSFVDSTEKDPEGGEKKEFELPDESFVVCIYGKRDELFRSNEMGIDMDDTTQRWMMWGLVLTQVDTGPGKQSFERLLSFSEILVTTDESLFSNTQKFRII
ncbi:HET-domain-containing protein [Karstenula rhodostoma CBS 690.94]|uniref:HET-domain-containing protein n=1 Tax=Karstenula rhodostoma CBS 690.94 TaxID=1392251 RepID=A0A9P4PX33_9PLEO|nr:HET-domain-containing protein [Karstenula rhodostoma CBS 690.94]